MSNLNSSIAKEITLKAIESNFLPKGKNGKESAKIVLDFYHELLKNVNDDHSENQN